VIAAIQHEELDYTPHNVVFTSQMLQHMVKHTGNPGYLSTIDNHIETISLRKKEIPVAGRQEHFVDEFNVIWNKSGVDKDIGAAVDFQIDDIDALAAFEPPEVDEAYIRSQCSRLMENKSDRFAFASVGFTLFERSWSLCGMENMLCYMITDPDVVESLMEKLADYNIKKARIALEYDIDGVLYGDDWGQQKGLIMGAPLWRELIAPHVARMYAVVKDAGKFIGQHSCGDNSEILDELIGMGLNVYQTFQPEIYDIHEYKKKLEGRLTIWGGISAQRQLPFLTPSEIYDLTRNTMAVLGEGGGYIASPTHAAPGDIPPENIDAMVRAFLEH
jgi:uroporphyrinogen decarboxylase